MIFLQKYGKTKIVIDNTFLIGNSLGVYGTKCLILKRENFEEAFFRNISQ